MGLILLIIVLILLFGGGGGYYAYNRYDGHPGWTGSGIFVPLVMLLLVLWLLGVI
jgi:hypothetical protein